MIIRIQFMLGSGADIGKTGQSAPLFRNLYMLNIYEFNTTRQFLIIVHRCLKFCTMLKNQPLRSEAC